MRRTIRRDNIGVALFPFLAVLICTMGSLIVLLVLLVQQARVDAKSIAEGKAIAAAAATEQNVVLQQEIEDAQWRRELLEQSRAEKAQELADARVKLAHMEDHIRRLEQRARELLERAKDIDEGKRLKDDELEAARDELARLQSEVERKKSELEEATKRQANAEQWFALIPYDGPNHTRRRPIYIECTSAGIVIQPEGIALRPEDFDGPLGPGNPLDAALRTIREHLSRSGASDAGEPYPLLVVRPSGVVAYNYARAALKSWDDEFGYELIEDDKKLVYGDPDPALVNSLQRTVAVARQRQAAMIAMMPRQYHGDVPLTSFAPEPAAQTAGSSIANRAGRGIGIGEGGYGSGESTGNGSGGNGGSLAGNPAAPYSGNTRAASASPLGAAGQLAGNAATPAGHTSGPYGGPYTGQATGQAGGQATGAGGQTGATAGGQAGSMGGTVGGAASGQPSAGQMSGPAGATTDSGQPGGAPGANLQFGSSQPPPAGSTQASNNRGGSKSAGAAHRGSNWALPGANRHAIAVTRPMPVAVLPDRFVLMRERGDDRLPQQISVSPQMTAQQADAFVAAVQREMKSWGLAVENGYWKPVLNVEVAPDAEHQFQSLQAALEGSGFEVRRKTP